MSTPEPSAAVPPPVQRAGSVPALWTAVAVALRVAWLTVVPPVSTWDGDIYHRTAERIARGEGFVDSWNNLPPFHPTAFYPVGYPAVLGAFYAVFGAHPWVVGLLNVLAAAVCTAVATRLALTAAGTRSAHVAGALYALSPGAVVYSSAYMTEPLSAALLAGAVAAGLAHARAGRAPSALLAGVLLGACGLVRPPALLVAPALALACAPTPRARSLVRSLLLVGVACAAVVLPWTARNCRVLDGCALVSVNAGSNLWIGADPAAGGGYRDLRSGEGCDAGAEVAKDRCYGALARRRIGRAPGAWLRLIPRKLDRMFATEGTPVAYLATAGSHVFDGTARFWMRLMTSWHRALLALALLAAVPVGLARRGAHGRAVVAVGAAVAALAAVHAVFFGQDRYHFVLTPLLCALAGCAFAAPPPGHDAGHDAVRDGGRA